jgi:Uri superfamily endonuclease
VPAARGCYVVWLRLTTPVRLRVGRAGIFDLPGGYYAYVGSAFGPGGLRARLGRHWSGARCCHWHVDYLRAVAAPVAAWYQAQQLPTEHAWAAILASGSRFRAVRGFGCSDCRCEAHLFHVARMPAFAAFRRRLEAAAPGASPLARIGR